MGEPSMLQQLMATVPAEFVAARNQLVKELAAAGDRTAADRVKAMRRPGVADWAFNVAAGVAPDLTMEFITAASSVLDAQRQAMAGRRGGDLRGRLQELRRRTADLVVVAHRQVAERGVTGRGSVLADLTAHLGEIAASPGALDLMSRRLLGTEEPGDSDPFQGVVLDAEASPEDEQDAAPDVDPAADAAAARAEAIEAAEAALAEAERDVVTRREDVATAADALAAAERRCDEAAAALAAERDRRSGQLH